MEGVVAFYSAKDIPGQNIIIGAPILFFVEDEELFVDGRVKYHGQPAGVIVATSFNLALKAASVVQIYYAKQPEVVTLTTMEDVLVNENEKKLRVIHGELQKSDLDFEGKKSSDFC